MPADRNAVKTSYTRMDVELLAQTGKALVAVINGEEMRVEAMTVDGGALFINTRNATHVYALAGNNVQIMQVSLADAPDERKSPEEHVEHMAATMSEKGVSHAVPVADLLR